MTEETTGQIIFNQINALTPQMVRWSWGASTWKTFSEKFFQDIPHLGGLIFKVNGIIHQGHVMIQLSPNDTYVVSVGKLYGGKFRKTKSFDNIYFDQLPSVLNDLIEKDPRIESAGLS